jgi:dihydropyrimidinase
MSTFEVAVENARLTLPGEETFSGSLGIRDGRIAALSGKASPGSADRIIDANGLHVLPGVVDAHSHYGLGNDQDFVTEARSAARAGITTTISYLLKPEADYSTPFAAMKLDGQTHSCIDFGFHFGVSSNEQARLLTHAADEFGVTSHKYFTSFKRPGEGDYIGVNAGHDGILYAVMREVANDPRVTLVVHSETIEVVWTLAEELKAAGEDGLAAWDRSRPAFTEADSIATVGMFSKVTGARVYIPHVSSAAGLAEVRRFGRHRPIVETCPHYLTHTREDAFDGSLGKVNPPLRSRSDVDALWEGIIDGVVDVIGSDHNSRPRSKKMTDIWSASAGFPSQGTMLPAVLTEGAKRAVPLPRLVELLCSSPAQVFGRYPQKGTLLPGSDADFVVVDLAQARRPDPASWGSSSDYSLDEGNDLIGWPVATYLRGQPIWTADAGWADGARGHYVPGGTPSYRISGRVGG